MSRSFIKEDGNESEDLPERRSSGLPNYVTPGGRDALRRRVEELSAARVALLAQRGEPDARRRLSQIESDLLYFRERLESAQVVENAGCGAAEIRFGARVEVRDRKGVARAFRIVGEDEADAGAGLISWASPLAAALLGHKAGDRVSWTREEGEEELVVVTVGY
ncbi:MAG: GreA/GreB family elongation factor [Elusimicrobia bacterium]|nr:GreA/GreB family elongation factor [Elusimicrobiota bacterium]